MGWVAVVGSISLTPNPCRLITAIRLVRGLGTLSCHPPSSHCLLLTLSHSLSLSSSLSSSRPCRLITVIGLERGLDTLVWQLIASVAAPGYTIHTVVAAANWALLKAEESQQASTGKRAEAAGPRFIYVPVRACFQVEEWQADKH